MKYIIVDLDNCISDDGWRQHRIQKDAPVRRDRYNDYYLLAPFDEARNLDRIDGMSPIIITGRPLEYLVPTQEWLTRHGILPALICMRPNGNFKPSPVMKAAALRSILDAGVLVSEIALAIDDRDDILAEYAKLGIATQRVFINEKHEARGTK